MFTQNPDFIDINVPYIAINETIIESIDSSISNFSFIQHILLLKLGGAT
jgi:hypothetical protein